MNRIWKLLPRLLAVVAILYSASIGTAQVAQDEDQSLPSGLAMSSDPKTVSFTGASTYCGLTEVFPGGNDFNSWVLATSNNSLFVGAAPSPCVFTAPCLADTGYPNYYVIDPPTLIGTGSYPPCTSGYFHFIENLSAPCPTSQTYNGLTFSGAQELRFWKLSNAVGCAYVFPIEALPTAQRIKSVYIRTSHSVLTTNEAVAWPTSNANRLFVDRFLVDCQTVTGVRFVDTSSIRLPDVSVGQNTYAKVTCLTFLYQVR